MVNWHIVTGTLAGLIGLGAIIPYIRDILQKKARPNAVSFTLWTFLLLISISAQISAGSSWSVMLLIGDLVGTSTVVMFCIMGYGYRKYGRLEWICTILAIVAIVLWQLTHEPVLAITFAILADTMASIPTLIKTIKDPRSETPTMWFLLGCGAILSIASTTIFNLPNLLFPIYLFLINGLSGVFSFLGRRAKQVSI